ncbi:MAG: Asp-tRNA(Asn)/Glu-tRNA(Gln) amidotransferase subunit GatB [Oscillospiraceae bacterium]
MNSEFEIVIGLEVHAELSTKTKIFCGCKNSFGAEVNTLCCPICIGLPGSLPVLNENVVFYAIKAGSAFNCTINNVSKQDRKNYFYPDLPKAYQISQFEVPLCGTGYLEFLLDDEVKKVGITRIQIEEDAGKLLHDDSFDGSLVDFNRCGVPLIEIISEPDIRSSKEAKAYLENIRRILMSIDVCDGKMEEGSIRCDINVSVREKGSNVLGTRVEMKNVNSFSATTKAIEYEASRQIEAIKNGETIKQETRKWDDVNGVNILMRNKENANDYRFFKDPDLCNIVVDDETIEKLKGQIGELTNYKHIRFVKEYGLSNKEAEQLISNFEKCEFFEDVIKENNKLDAKVIANWILGDLSRIINANNCKIKDTKLTPKKLSELITLISNNTISNAAGKEIFACIVEEGADIDSIIKEKNLIQISDTSMLEEIVDNVIKDNENAVNDYKNGKTNILGFLVGQCMKQSKGQGNPSILKDIILKKI